MTPEDTKRLQEMDEGLYLSGEIPWLISLTRKIDAELQAVKLRQADWIKPSERLPEESVSVLICWRTDDGFIRVNEGRILRYDFSTIIDWFVFDDETPFPENPPYPVIGWMPMPEPMKE